MLCCLFVLSIKHKLLSLTTVSHAGVAATPGSTASSTLMWAVVGLQASYASILTVLRPQLDRVQGYSEIFCIWLETASMLCSCLLQTMQASAALQQVNATRVCLEMLNYGHTEGMQ